jgi:hypothetical protein
MGVPLTGPSFIYADNKSQVTNSTRPESTLKKKCNSICALGLLANLGTVRNLKSVLLLGNNR